MKVVWLCHFANENIARKIGVNSGMDFAPWISELIKLFTNKNDVKLYIVAPNYYNNKNLSFQIDNVNIYLFKYKLPLLSRRADNLSLNYVISRKSVKNIINEIKPDLIHLHGSENPIYSAAVIPLMHKYPVLVTIQGFVSLSSKRSNLISQFIRWNRIRFERKINSKASFFTITTNDGLKTLKTFTKTAKIYQDHYPTTKPDVSSLDFPNKIYDIAYYARISKDKGIEDLIEAIRILKKTRPSINAIIIGGGSKPYTAQIETLIQSLDLNNNINFAGFLPSQQDVFKLAAQARVYVLPTYFDGLPGSIREAMFMSIPVVAYAVGGIPSLNEEKECITLVEKQNINELVEKIELVLDNTERTNNLVENAYEVITDKYDNGKIYINLLTIYKDILNANKK